MSAPKKTDLLRTLDQGLKWSFSLVAGTAGMLTGEGPGLAAASAAMLYEDIKDAGSAVHAVLSF